MIVLRYCIEIGVVLYLAVGPSSFIFVLCNIRHFVVTC